MAENKYIEDLLKLGKIAIHINEHQYDDLEVFLSDYDWDLVGEIILIPSNVRGFIKEIEDAEVRLDVARFLKKYAEQYLREAAERLEYAEAEKNAVSPSLVRKREKSAEEYIEYFQQELGFLIEQIEQAGEFTGDHVARLKKRIADLEKQVKELQEQKRKLEDKIYEYEHRGDGHYIPEKLVSHEFNHIVQLLIQKQLVVPHYGTDSYGYQRLAYMTWKGRYDLFGYFVDKISYELELRDSGGRLQWKLFAKAFDNYKKIERAAKNAVAYYQNHPEAKKPEDADIIDEIIQIASAYEAERQAKEKRI